MKQGMRVGQLIIPAYVTSKNLCVLGGEDTNKCRFLVGLLYRPVHLDSYGGWLLVSENIRWKRKDDQASKDLYL